MCDMWLLVIFVLNNVFNKDLVRPSPNSIYNNHSLAGVILIATLSLVLRHVKDFKFKHKYNTKSYKIAQFQYPINL